MPSKSLPHTYLSYGLVYNQICRFDALVVVVWTCYNLSLYEKLGLRVKKYVFIKYPECSKGSVNFVEHFDRGMTEIESRDFDS